MDPVINVPEKNFILPASVRDMILAYLYSQPYAKVAHGVDLLNGLIEIPGGTQAVPLVAVAKE
jgi:hypothetical protein